jgi:phosphoenolpyruvate-protein kinase (PTS system EI component)
LVDGRLGEIIVYPSPQQLTAGEAAEPEIRLERRVPVHANIGSVAEARYAVTAGAEGIGLLRTEFLFQQRRTPPSEEEQVDQYTAILRCLDGKPVVIRTLDTGADKPVPFLPLPAEANPQLGVRGIRLSLQQPEIFRTQLRALLRAAATGPLKILIPMVTMPEEMREVRALLTEIADELATPLPPIGAMIEVPMAALAAPELAAVCDFFSLGTNDLLQFLLAADRQHAGVGYLHASDLAPVWRLIGPVISAAHARHIPVSVCGEWGADPEMLSHLLEFGIDTVSVSVGAITRIQAMMPPS